MKKVGRFYPGTLAFLEETKVGRFYPGHISAFVIKLRRSKEILSGNISALGRKNGKVRRFQPGYMMFLPKI